MKITLRTKLILFSTLLVTVVMTNVTYFFTIREINARRAAIELQVQRIARNIATLQLLDRQDWGVYQNYISQLLAFNPDIVYIAVFDERNTIRAHELNNNLIELDQPIFTRRMEADLVRRLDGGAVAEESRDDLLRERVNIQVGDRVLGSVSVGFSIIEINEAMQEQIVWNIVMALLFILLFSSLSAWISRRLSRPLERLNHAMNAIRTGNLEQQVEAETHDEIAQLTRSFNEMIAGLRERQIIENLGYELSATFQSDRLAPLVRERLKSAIGAAGARLYIKRSGGTLFYEITTGDAQQIEFPPLEVDRNTLAYLRRESKGFMIRQAPEAVMQALRHDRHREDGLVIPMMVKDELLGLLFLALPLNQQGYSEQQRHFASILANQAAFALENARLYEELREQERMKRELEIAREMQQKLLPVRMPEVAGYRFDGFCQPAREVGGDYFDFFRLDRDHIGIVVADVSGHGTSASFYMAEIKGMMLHLTSVHHSPRQLLIDLNQKLYRNLDRRAFVTMIYGVICLPEQRFTFARAGHNSLLRIATNGDHQIFTPRGIGLGLDPGPLFAGQLEEVDLALNRDETLILYTDGITEARNGGDLEFGEDGLLRSLSTAPRGDVREMRQGILNALKGFLNGRQPHDDITLVLVHCE